MIANRKPESVRHLLEAMAKRTTSKSRLSRLHLRQTLHKILPAKAVKVIDALMVRWHLAEYFNRPDRKRLIELINRLNDEKLPQVLAILKERKRRELVGQYPNVRPKP